MANSVDPDETPHSAASHLGLYCLLRPVCPNTYGKYGILCSVFEAKQISLAKQDILVQKSNVGSGLSLLGKVSTDDMVTQIICMNSQILFSEKNKKKQTRAGVCKTLCP